MVLEIVDEEDGGHAATTNLPLNDVSVGQRFGEGGDHFHSSAVRGVECRQYSRRGTTAASQTARPSETNFALFPPTLQSLP